MMNAENPDNKDKERHSEERLHHPDSKPLLIPVIEEQLVVDRELVESGKVTITKKVNEVLESIDIPLMQEEVNVDRISINQYVENAPPTTRQEGDTTIIPILKEVLVVEKRLLLVEEVRITKKQVKTSESREETLKKEEVVITREQK